MAKNLRLGVVGDATPAHSTVLGSFKRVSAGGWLQKLREFPWRKLVPPRWGWLHLVSRPSSYILIVGLVLTVWAKTRAVYGLDDVSLPLIVTLWTLTGDVLVHLGFAALLAVAEGRFRWAPAVTVAMALLLTCGAAANAAYLSRAGEQLTWEAIALAQERSEDLGAIIREQLHHIGLLTWSLGVAVVVAVPTLAGVIVRKRVARSHETNASHRAHCAATCVVVALAMWLVVPPPHALSAKQLDGNATIATYWGWVTGEDPAQKFADVEFEGYRPAELVDARAVAELVRGDRPNFVFLVLESTRHDFTSLAEGAKAQTPHLALLARRGVEVRTTRAALPHTTKSLFSIFCGRLPLMQRAILEVSQTVDVQCLPDILAAAGYRTGFFQSALGIFEQRPRLADNLGFSHFASWEDIGGETLGYLASDDESLAQPTIEWIRQKPDQPFMAVVLTSAPHHPYRLPDRVRKRAPANADSKSDEDRFALLVEAQDRLLGRLVDSIQAAGVIHKTIFVVVGDHGEGFGRKGVRQHDNNFYEEGLRVPWVMAGPGIPHTVVDGNASLVDVTPTVLGVLGIRPSDRAASVIAGRDVLSKPIADEPRWFSCWYDFRCRGFVWRHYKVVYIPQTNRAAYFDLKRDPEERHARPLTAELDAFIPQLHRAIEAYRTRNWPYVAGPLRHDYGVWTCNKGEACSHPRAPGELFRE